MRTLLSRPVPLSLPATHLSPCPSACGCVWDTQSPGSGWAGRLVSTGADTSECYFLGRVMLKGREKKPDPTPQGA